MKRTRSGDRRVAWGTQRARWLGPATLGVCLVAFGLAANCRSNDRAGPVPSGLQIGVALPRAGTPSVGVRALVNTLRTEALVGIGWDGRPTPRVAVHWTTYEGGRRLRLRIHPKVRFHDGTFLTASHVRELLLKEVRGTDVPLSYSSIVSIDTIDDDEIDLALSRPEAFLVTDLISTSVTHPQNAEVGIGPYRAVQDEDGQANTPAAGEEFARLEAFPQYFRGAPRTEYVDIKEYATQRNAWAALMRGEINALHEVSPAAFDFVEKESSIRTYSFLRPYYSYLAFNMSHPVLGRREVRQALNQAVNRDDIIKRALHGRGQPAEGPIWPFHWAYSTAQRGFAYNPEAARLRLDAAGLTVPHSPVPGRMPSRLRFTCLIFDDPRWEQTALLLQKQLFDIGVEMEFEALPFVELTERMSQGKFDAFLFEYASARSLTWAYYTWHSSQPIPYSPRIGYRAADRVLDRLRHATTDQEIRVHVGELQRTLYEDPPAIFIAWPYSSRAVSTSFEVPVEANTDILGNIWQWRAGPQAARR